MPGYILIQMIFKDFVFIFSDVYACFLFDCVHMCESTVRGQTGALRSWGYGQIWATWHGC